MHEHRWTYRNGRSWCADCGAWANDLRCCPSLRQQGGRYPTATDLQRDYACADCYGNLLARMEKGRLRVVCPHCDRDILNGGRVIHQRKRDYIIALQVVDAMEVLDGLPAELRALVA